MSASAGGLPWHALSVAPFVMGILRYAVDADAAASDEPEGIVLGDRGLQLIGVVWLALLLLGVHGG
jgi:decaprenyl-phosphate phosphoribosyltransferase